MMRSLGQATKWWAAGMLACAALATSAPGLSAQTVGTNKEVGQNGSFTLKVNSQLVVEMVVVKDKEGHFVPGLTPKNFNVEEEACRSPSGF